MRNVKRILFLVWLNVSTFNVHFCITQECTHQNIERKTMNDHKSLQNKNSDWIGHIKQTMTLSKGTF